MTNFSKKWDEKEKCCDNNLGYDKDGHSKSLSSEDIEEMNSSIKIIDKIKLKQHPQHIAYHIEGTVIDFILKCSECDFTLHHKAWWKFW